MRRIVFIDAVTCIAMGALLVMGARVLAPVLGLPDTLLQYSGLSLFPIAAFMLWVATRSSLPRASSGAPDADHARLCLRRRPGHSGRRAGRARVR